MLPRPYLTYLFLLVSSHFALAPASAETARTSVGRPVGLKVSFTCGDTIAPSFFVAEKPKNGRVEIRIYPTTRGNCPNGQTVTKARAAYYVPNPGFSGTDTLTLEWPSSGWSFRPAMIPYTITVSGSGR